MDNKEKVYIVLNCKNQFIVCDSYIIEEGGNWIECNGLYNGTSEEKAFTIPMTSIKCIETSVR